MRSLRKSRLRGSWSDTSLCCATSSGGAAANIWSSCVELGNKTPPTLSSSKSAGKGFAGRRFAGGLVAAGLALLTVGGTAPAAHANDDAMIFPMTADSARYWRFLSDRVMGGVSDGNLKFVTIDGRAAGVQHCVLQYEEAWRRSMHYYDRDSPG